MNITSEQQTAIAEKLRDMHLPAGLGDEENACSIAAINLALTGELTDDIPNCMSEVIGRWIIKIQDSMPDEMRNSVEWKSLLPLAAGTGREKEKEKERLAIILDWMWGTVLPTLQPLADKEGFGAEWKSMTEERTAEAAAEAAARAAEAAVRAAAAYAARAWAAARAARAAAWAAEAAARATAGKDSWEAFDPCALLDRLIRA